MARLIKNIRGIHIVEYDKGAFDDWCVYLTRQGQRKYAPKDTEYFAILASIGEIYGKIRLYGDFVTVYENTTRNIDTTVLDKIIELADYYGEDAEELEIWFTVIYAGMVAEENKAFTKLGRRIKRLGMHQVLIEGMDPIRAANFSKGKKWRDLDNLMLEKGF